MRSDWSPQRRNGRSASVMPARRWVWYGAWWKLAGRSKNGLNAYLYRNMATLSTRSGAISKFFWAWGSRGGRVTANYFQNYFTVRIGNFFLKIILSLKISSHFKCVATLPCEISSVLKARFLYALTSSNINRFLNFTYLFFCLCLVTSLLRSLAFCQCF